MIGRKHAAQVGGLLFAVAVVEGSLAHAGETQQDKIKRALSAAPHAIAKAAKVVDIDEQGKMTVLREGTNGFTCFPGHPGVFGDVAICADRATIEWIRDLMADRLKPTNTEPGIAYMLAGGADWSAADPFATSGTPIEEPPHWMMMWPFDPVSTGLPTAPKQAETWIMDAGTPWAHLMINQRP